MKRYHNTAAHATRNWKKRISGPRAFRGRRIRRHFRAMARPRCNLACVTVYSGRKTSCNCTMAEKEKE